MVEERFITTSDGTRIPVPQSEPTYSIGEDGIGWVAMRANPEQVNDYYRAACSEDVSVAWADDLNYSNFESGLSDTVTRYDQSYEVDPLDKIYKDIPSQIKYIRERYEKDDPLVRGIVDVLTDMTCGSVRLEGGTDEVRKQFSNWHLNIIEVNNLVEKAAVEYWLSGNDIISVLYAPFTKRANLPFLWKETPSEDVNSLLSLSEKLLTDREEDRILLSVLNKRFGLENPFGTIESEAAKKNRYTNTLIPTSYIVMDPLTLVPSGRANDPDYSLKADSDMIKRIKEGKDIESLIAQYGQEFVDAIKSGKKSGKIESEKLRTFFSKKPDYSYWGYVPGGSAIMYMQLKRRLGNLGLNTISQAISYIVLIRLGSDKFPIKGVDQLKAMSKLWRERSRKNASAAFFQPHTTEIEIISPPASSMQLLTANAYDNPNIQIAQSYGINLALITGVSTSTISYSFAAMAVRPTVRRIIACQRKIEEFLYREHLAIGRALGYEEKEIPRAMFMGTGLENARELASAFESFLDRGFPMKYYLENLGVDFQSAVEQARFEQELGVDSLFPMRGSPNQVSNLLGRPGIPQEKPVTKDSPEKEQREAGNLNLQEVYQEIREKDGFLKG